MIKIPIKTDKSFLSIQPFDNKDLIKRSIDDIEDKLIKNPKIYIYGKEATQHRDVGFFSNESIGYRYSNQLAKSQFLTDNLMELLEKMNDMFNTNFNGILINKYYNGDDYIGTHSDDEKNLSDIGVVCISYGVTRKFRIRDKSTKKIVMDISLKENEIVHMGGNFQKEFTHEIPIEKKIKGVRYSFTFRKHNK